MELSWQGAELAAASRIVPGCAGCAGVGCCCAATAYLPVPLLPIRTPCPMCPALPIPFLTTVPPLPFCLPADQQQGRRGCCTAAH